MRQAIGLLKPMSSNKMKRFSLFLVHFSSVITRSMFFRTLLIFCLFFVFCAVTLKAQTVNTPTFVQSADCSELNGDPITAASSTFHCRLPQPSLGGSGDVIVCGFVNDGTTTRGWSLSDGSNTYTYVTKTDTTNTEILVAGYAMNDSSVQTIIFTSNSGVALRGPWCGEWTGVGGGFDQSTPGNNASSTTVTAGTSNTSPAASGELIVQQAYNEYSGVGYSAGASTFSAGSQANISWSLIVHDTYVPMAVQAGVYNSTSGITPTMSETTAGFVSQALFFKPGSGPAIPSGIWVSSLKHFWLSGMSSPFTEGFPCPATDNVAYYSFTGGAGVGDDTTAVTVNGHAMTQTHAKLVDAANVNVVHNYYLQNQTLSPSQTIVISGTLTTGNAMAYCFASTTPSTSYQSSSYTSNSGNQQVNSSTLPVGISIIPHAAGNILFTTTSIANNTITGLTSGDAPNEFWSNSIGNSEQMDQGNGFGFMLAPNTSAQSFTYSLYFTTSDPVGNWLTEADEFATAASSSTQPAPPTGLTTNVQ